MPYREIELEFSTNEQQNTIVIFGENMRGKTSILNIIRWAFYGKALKRHSRSIPLQDIVNKNAVKENDWKVEVEIEFYANEHRYVLRRSAEKRESVAVPVKPTDFAETVRLTRDGATILGGQIKEEIESIVPEQISRFFLFDGELLQEYEALLIEGDQQGQQIKKAVEQILGVPAFQNGRSDIQTILRQAQRQQGKDLRQDEAMKQHAEEYENLVERESSIDYDLEDLKKKLYEVQEEQNTLREELEVAESFTSVKTTLEEKKKLKKYLEDKCVEKEEEQLKIVSEAWKDLIESQLRVKRPQLEKERKVIMGNNKKRAILESKIADLEDLLNTLQCPTCEQTIKDEHKFRISQTLEKNKVELSSIENEGNEAALQNVLVQLDTISKIRGVNAKNQLSQIDRELQNYQVRLTKVENEIEQLEKEITEHDTAEIDRKRWSYEQTIKEESRLQGSIEKQNSKKDEIKKELGVRQKILEDCRPSGKSTIKVRICSGLEKIFSQSIEQLRDELKKEVEAQANGAFKSMITQKKYQGLEINDNYGLQIVDASGDYVPVRSAGAEQIVALSLIDGLNRTGRPIGPVIMDTPFGRLDLNHRKNILNYLPSVTNQLVLLVHSGEMSENDLGVIAERVYATYKIEEISSTQSRLRIKRS